MSLRDRLAAKARRRVSFPVQVSDPTADQERAAGARTQLAVGQATGITSESIEALREAVTAADAAVEAHFVDVEFEALAPDLFEELLAANAPGGDVDQPAMRIALAAACAVDEELRDEQWWAEQFASGAWSPGELADLYYRLFTVLHYTVPAGGVSKG
ncbi:hypothetical protein ACTHAM_002354 [Cellulomonas soli]|uniref:hypothetical protein n=1 Tax=Cellulomonas soli TaxID=931535 RepID=UPI003F879F4C